MACKDSDVSRLGPGIGMGRGSHTVAVARFSRLRTQTSILFGSINDPKPAQTFHREVNRVRGERLV